jgi:tape measure domain-containing protein
MSNDKAEFEVELVDDLSDPAKDMSGALGKLLESVDKFHGIDAFEWVKAHIIEQAIDKVAELGKELVEGTFEMASFGQEARDSFATITGNVVAGQVAFEKARHLAVELGLDIEKTAGRMQQFMRLGFTDEQAEQFVKMGADMTNLGISAEKVDGIMGALSRMQAKGALDSRAMMELAGAGVQVSSVYERLGGTLGKSQEQIKKMAEAGKITAAQAIEAIQAELLGKLGESAFGEKAAEDAATQIDGIKGVIKAQLQDLQLTIGDRIAPSITAAMSTAANSLREFLASAQGRDAIDALVLVISKLAEGFVFAVAHIGDFVNFMRDAWDILKAVAPYVAIVAGLFAAWAVGMAVSMIPALVTIGIVLLTTVVPGLIATAAATLAAAAPFVLLGAAILGVVYAIMHWGEIADWIRTKWGELVTWFSTIDWGQVGLNIINGIVGGITSGISRVAEAARNIGSTVTEGVSGFLNMNSPSVVMHELGEFTALGFAGGIAANTNHVETAADGMSAAAVAPVAGSAGAGGGGHSFTFSPVINATAGPGATAKDGEAFASGLEPQLRRMWLSWLEDLATEAA